MNFAVKIENLSYKNILRNISVNINKNSIYALVGPSRSGKTTFLKCLIGLINYEGKINNKFYSKNQKINKNFGLYLDSIELIENNVFLNLMSPLLNLGISETKAKKEVFKISKLLELDQLLYVGINKLSYSEKKLVLFAKTVIHKPELILLDNIFDGLDKKSKNQIITFLTKAKDCTVIFTTNNSEDLLMSDNIIILNEGQLITCDNTKEAFLNEKLFTKNHISLPFIVELSHKLKSYNLIEDLILDSEEMVDAIWK